MYPVTSGSEAFHASVNESAYAVAERPDATKQESATIADEPRARGHAARGAVRRVAGAKSDVTPGCSNPFDAG